MRRRRRMMMMMMIHEMEKEGVVIAKESDAAGLFLSLPCHGHKRAPKGNPSLPPGNACTGP